MKASNSELFVMILNMGSELQKGNLNTSQIITLIILASTCIGVAAKALQKLIKSILVAIETIKKIRSKFANESEKHNIRRRAQFCMVLRSDIDSLSKSENWNDQWFTDLEAEVEAQGRYYNSNIERLVGKKAYGIRRVPSLMAAIQTSAERCILVVGDPGSGKSVALRHLARDLADKGCADRKDSAVPLYINLKELPSCDFSKLNADYIQKFVLDNIRRGDADTAAYVKEHWKQFKEEGRWFFLFDSFDEIPAVLHAPNGSQAIARYGNALRQFMDGMGACRGVLASREYKGPEAMPWQKFKILPLNTKRQDELIENTFLSPGQKDLVRQHLAVGLNNIYGNPLFLSLLCRYVSDNKRPPINDHDLLVNHILRLSRRDSNYIQDKYHLDPEQLISGATFVAVLLAERSDLSLAPTIDEIFLASNGSEWNDNSKLGNLLSALIEIKIGRSDVKEARPGDRRFTFSHRRYQESLFVEYVANNPSHIGEEQLLMDSRWREFTVTLIQSQLPPTVNRFADAAVNLLGSMRIEREPVCNGFSESLNGVFRWQDSPVLHLLTLLNEGFGRRLELVSPALRDSVKKLLSPVLQNGDIYDGLMVVKHGCLLPSEDYEELLEWAISTKLDPLRHAAFVNARFLGEMPDEMCQWVRRRLADETLSAADKIELHKLDALSNHLPANINATLIFKRCKSLRNFFYGWVLTRVALKSLSSMWKGINFIVKDYSDPESNLRSNISSLYFLIFYGTPIILVTMLLGLRSFLLMFDVNIGGLSTRITIVIALVVMLSLALKIMLRAAPRKLSVVYVLKTLKIPKFDKYMMSIIAILVTVVSLIIGMLLMVGKFYGAKGYICLLSVLGILFTLGCIISLFRKRRCSAKLNSAVNGSPGINKCAIVQLAINAEELLLWIQQSPLKEWLKEHLFARTLIVFIQHRFVNNEGPLSQTQITSIRGLHSELLKNLSGD